VCLLHGYILYYYTRPGPQKSPCVPGQNGINDVINRTHTLSLTHWQVAQQNLLCKSETRWRALYTYTTHTYAGARALIFNNIRICYALHEVKLASSHMRGSLWNGYPHRERASPSFRCVYPRRHPRARFRVSIVSFFFSEVFAATITAAQITYYHGDPVAFAIVVVEFFYYLVSHTHTRRVRNILAGPTIIFRRWFKCTTERRVYIYPGNSVNVTSSSQTSVNTVISPYIGRHSLSSFSTASFFFASSSSIYTRPALLLLYIIFSSIYI